MRQFINSLVGTLVGFLIVAVIYFIALPPRGQAVQLLPEATPGSIVVHVVGSVSEPGVYTLPAGSRVQDAVEAAGGLLEEVDPAVINLAARLEDGQQVAVGVSLIVPADNGSGGLEGTDPGQGGTDQGLAPPPPGGEPGEVPSGLININTATLEQLDTLPGIGPVIAQRIIDYRTTNGPFEMIEDLMDVPGIGPSTFERIKDLITVGSP